MVAVHGCEGLVSEEEASQAFVKQVLLGFGQGRGGRGRGGGREGGGGGGAVLVCVARWAPTQVLFRVERLSRGKSARKGRERK